MRTLAGAVHADGRRGKRSSRRDDLVPYGAVAAAVLAIVFLLPSALRPPQTPPTQSAELSPDAPPDENTDSIISSLNRGQSGTGDGTGVGEGPGEGASQQVVVNGTTLPPKPAPPAAACPFGYGKPPRQTFSIYSPPCAAAFTGDNGGATSPGVTATEIHVVVSGGGTEGWADQRVTGTSGEEGDADRTWRIYQEWVNTHYQFYGRKLRLYKMDQGGSPDEQRAKVARMVDEIKTFAVVTFNGGDLLQEAARRKIVGTGELNDQFQDSFTDANRPYIWTWHASATRMRKMIAEYICARLTKRWAKFAGPAYQNQQRVFGVIYDETVGKGNAGEEIERYTKQGCDQTIKTKIGVAQPNDPAAAGAGIGTAVARLINDGVTSVIVPVNWLYTGALAAAAAKQAYVPEWIISGEGLNDYNVQARTNDKTEWRHAFGISPLEIEEPQDVADNTTYWDAHRAYHEIDPTNNPARGPALFFMSLQQIANGIQMAGPNLTPETFEKGMFSIPLREGAPSWAASGGYRPGNYGFATAVGEIWWDETATDSVGNPGAYKWTRNATRWKLGEIPPGETTVFEEGVAVRPPDWANY